MAESKIEPTPTLPPDLRRPMFGRCSLGKGRWFWVALPEGYEDFCRIKEYEPVAYHSGYCANADEALAAARAAIAHLPNPRPLAPGWVSTIHRNRVRQSRVPAIGDGSSFVWDENYSFDYSFPKASWICIPHAEVKRTARRVFVERDAYRPGNRSRVGTAKWALHLVC
jgi:hypothetical protein